MRCAKFFVIPYTIISIVFLTICAYNVFYNWGLSQIAIKLKSVKNAEVINIWGHEDVTLEEISARIKIDDSIELVLDNLSMDVNNYPETVMISEIGNYTFKIYICNGSLSTGSSLDIGSVSYLGKKMGVTFNQPEDVIKNYRLILKIIGDLKKGPDLNYFINDGTETYLRIIEGDSQGDVDPIFKLVGVGEEFDYAEKLKWEKSECADF